jgi:hypothetical protein
MRGSSGQHGAGSAPGLGGLVVQLLERVGELRRITTELACLPPLPTPEQAEVTFARSGRIRSLRQRTQSVAEEPPG